jgi:DNA-binding XRE family transcriptional regulator
MTDPRRRIHKPPDLICASCATVIPRRCKYLRRSPVLCLRCADGPGVTLGQRLRAFRVAAGLTPPTLAKRAGVTQECITLAEREKHAVRPVILEKLVEVLGVELGRKAPLHRRLAPRG